MPHATDHRKAPSANGSSTGVSGKRPSREASACYSPRHPGVARSPAGRVRLGRDGPRQKRLSALVGSCSESAILTRRIRPSPLESDINPQRRVPGVPERGLVDAPWRTTASLHDSRTPRVPPSRDRAQSSERPPSRGIASIGRRLRAQCGSHCCFHETASEVGAVIREALHETIDVRIDLLPWEPTKLLMLGDS